MVTDSVTVNINGLYAMIDRLGLDKGRFCLDSAYLVREMCDAISAMGMVPHIMLKSNIVRNAKETSRGARWSTCTWTTGRHLTPSTTSAAP